MITDASELRDFTQPDELSDFTLVIDELSDFTLVMDGTPLHVHKQYLADWSPVWRQMFLDECSSPQGPREILMPDKNLQELSYRTASLHLLHTKTHLR